VLDFSFTHVCDLVSLPVRWWWRS